MRMLVAASMLLGVAALASAQSPQAVSAITDVDARCRAMVGGHPDIQDAPSHIVTGKSIPAKDGEPAHCLLEGYSAPNIGFELRLPAQDWNGKFFKVGCGGYCGFIASANCTTPLRKGYACLASDMGHKSTGLDAKWAYNNLQAEVDFGFRGTHIATLAGKALTRTFYGKAPARSYYMGASTGGRQGLMQAQRYPYDFDGIVAGVGPIDETGDGMTIMWNVLAMVDESGKPRFSNADMTLLHDAVLAKCDMDDGVKDGLMVNPRTCQFDVGSLQCSATKSPACFDAAQVAAVRKIYSGPVNSKGQKLFYGGAMPGSELTWIQSYVVQDGGGRYWAMMEDMFRFMAFVPDPGPTWSLRDFNWDEDYKRLGSMETLYSATNPDLRKFRDTGAKLIMYQGWWDQAVFPEMFIDYYESVEKLMGGREATQDFLRLFMIPGAAHGGTNFGATTVDYIAYLEDWVENGKAPEKLLGYRLNEAERGTARFPIDPAKVQYSRPHFPYPLQPRFTGKGDANDAANFKAVSK